MCPRAPIAKIGGGQLGMCSESFPLQVPGQGRYGVDHGAMDFPNTSFSRVCSRSNGRRSVGNPRLEHDEANNHLTLHLVGYPYSSAFDDILIVSPRD